MGAWGSGLYSNDSTCDVRDTYKGFLEDELSNTDAFEKTIEEYKEMIATDEEPLFWYALADTQWKTGRLMPEVKEKALDWIKKDGGMELWEESKSGRAGWKKTLEKLHAKLNTEQPKEKRFRRRVYKFQNPWALNDVYAYRVHKESNAKEELAIHGKFILMQKIGEGIGIHSKDTVMRVQIFDRVFDDLPSIEEALETLLEQRLLPFGSPTDQARRYRRMLQGKPDPFYWDEPLCIYNPVTMSVKIDQYLTQSYPKDEVTYICTAEGPLNKQHERTFKNSDGAILWSDIHYNIGRQFATWRGVEYDVVGDGTFEYPTREQQMQIKAELEK